MTRVNIIVKRVQRLFIISHLFAERILRTSFKCLQNSLNRHANKVGEEINIHL